MATDINFLTFTVDVTPTITAGAYSANDFLGALQTLTNAFRWSGSGTIQSVLVYDKDAQGIDMDIVYFSANPSNTTFTDNVPLTVHDSDGVDILGVALLRTHASFAASGVTFANNLGISLKVPSDSDVNNEKRTIYAAPILRGAPTYTSTTALTFRHTILQD